MTLSKNEKKTLLLDLDNTLILTVADSKDSGEDFNFGLENPDGSCTQFAVYFRYYAKEFIDRCKKIYNLGIFTAAEKEYAERILEELCPDVKLRFYRTECQGAENGSYVKDLTCLPGLPFDEKTVFLFDDRAPGNTVPRANGLFCPSFTHSNGTSNDLEIYCNVLCDNRFFDREDVRVPINQLETKRRSIMNSKLDRNAKEKR